MTVTNDAVGLVSDQFKAETWLVPATLRVSGMSIDSKESLVSHGFDVIRRESGSYVVKPPYGWKASVKEYSNVIIAELRDKHGSTQFTQKVGRYEGKTEFTQQGRAMSYSYGNRGERKTDKVLVVFFLGLLVLMFLGIGYLGVKNYNAAISVDQAQSRFQELTETENVVIVRHSNNSRISGNPGDVTFELLVDGHPATGRCLSSTFSEMVCRLDKGGS